MKKVGSALLCVFIFLSYILSGCSHSLSETEPVSIIVPSKETTADNTDSPETAPPETLPPETLPPETLPPETLPPETLPSETEPSPTEETSPTTVLNDEEIRSVIDDVAEKYGAAGIQVAIVDNGQITGSYASGWATIDTDPMTADHKLRVASLSKILIGITAMMLQEDGYLDLDSDIGAFWNTTARNPSYPDTPITIDSLLTHTSSVTAYANDGPMDYNTVRDRLTYGYGYGKPGDMGSWYYNNYAFRMLGMTLELAAGQTLDVYLRENLFDQMDIDAGFAPGDLESTDMLATLYWESNYAARSVQTQKDMHGPATPGEDGYHYSGGLTISAKELAKILTLLVSDGMYEGQQLLSPESVALMEECIPYQLYDGTYQARPMFYAPQIYGREGIYFHTGSGWGVYNCFSYDPLTGDGVVVLTSGASGGSDPYGIYWVCSEISEYIYGMIE